MIKQAWTRKDSTTYLACNTVNLRPALAYVDLNGKLPLKRVSATVSNSGVGTATYGMALYRANKAPFDRNRPILNLAGFSLSLVAALNTYTAADTNVRRYNGNLPRELLIDGDTAIYFLAFVISDIAVGRWRSGPTNEDDDFTFYALDTRALLTSPSAWPNTLHAIRSAVTVPSIVLRSSEGIFYLGSQADDP